MSNEKYYRYFKVTGDEAVKLLADYEVVGEKRKEVIKTHITKVGAVLHTEHRDWGGKTLVAELVFSADHQFPCEVKTERTDTIDGEKVVVVRGKGRNRGAREFNAMLSRTIRELNEALTECPKFKDYLIDHYNVRCSGLGEASGRGWGVAMLSTNCGKAAGSDDVLLFAIPSKSDECDQPEIPASFEEITYGQFYDLSTPT